ncbi:MAG TPA: hypothetical protein VHV55_10685 [Pirellulales bacterium]|jgi:MFS family permease|nr:hypothetical protein [Pirellulales bacterium]
MCSTVADSPRSTRPGPASPQRTFLRRFYLASFLAEATNLAMPFKMWLAVGCLGVAGSAMMLAIEQFASLVLEVPGGVWADRYGRKPTVVAGHLIVVLGWLLAPAASLLPHAARPPAMAAAFAMFGAGSALISGTQEAWAVDGLRAGGRADLVSSYFGRDRFWASSGGLLASLAVLVLAARVDIRLFSVVTGLGEIVAAVVLLHVPEERLTSSQPISAATVSAPIPEQGGSAMLWSHPELWSLTLALVWLAAALGLSTEVFQLALACSRVGTHGFAALELAANGLGAVAPLAAVMLLERYSPKSLLTTAIATLALLAASLCTGNRQGQLVATYLLVRTCSRALYTVADHFQHQLLASSQRATASSAINFLVAAAQLGSAMVIACLLRSYSPRAVLAMMGLLALPAAALLMIPHGLLRKPAWAPSETCA